MNTLFTAGFSFLFFPIYERRVRGSVLQDSYPIGPWTSRLVVFVPAFIGNKLSDQLYFGYRSLLRKCLLTAEEQAEARKDDVDVLTADLTIQFQRSGIAALPQIVPRLLRAYQRFAWLDSFKGVVCDALAAVGSLGTVYPLYWLITKLVASHEVSDLPTIAAKVDFVKDLVVSTYKNEGISAFYAGFLPLLGLAFSVKMIGLVFCSCTRDFEQPLVAWLSNQLGANQPVQSTPLVKAAVVGVLCAVASNVVCYPLAVWSTRQRMGLSPFGAGYFPGFGLGWIGGIYAGL